MPDNAFYNDEILLEGLRNGDEESFTSIYEKYVSDLFYKAEAILGDELLAEDCVQDVFMDLWKRRAEVKIDHLEAYLRRAVRFKSIDIIRNKKVHRKYYQRIAAASSELFLHNPLLFKELETLFEETLQSLPQDQREIFLLVREQNLTYREIAVMKGISVKTVEKKMSLSLRHLRIKLGELLHFLV